MKLLITDINHWVSVVFNPIQHSAAWDGIIFHLTRRKPGLLEGKLIVQSHINS